MDDFALPPVSVGPESTFRRDIGQFLHVSISKTLGQRELCGDVANRTGSDEYFSVVLTLTLLVFLPSDKKMDGPARGPTWPHYF